MRFLLIPVLLCSSIFIVNSQLIEFELYSDSAICFNDSSGRITIKITKGYPEFEIRLYDKKPAIKQKVLLKIISEDTLIVIDKLASKLYFITVRDAADNMMEKQIKIGQPEKLGFHKISVEKGLSDPGSSDAVLKVNPFGGTPPYTVVWDYNAGNQTGFYARNIGKGYYSCLINDANNCGPVEATITFNEFLFKDYMGTQQ
ncbi:MAG: SprB repeat-containing protein [Bacteroidales bacterium]|nr:SprB repeat-containing protein [Bacteroidales bacterium]